MRSKYSTKSTYNKVQKENARVGSPSLKYSDSYTDPFHVDANTVSTSQYELEIRPGKNKRKKGRKHELKFWESQHELQERPGKNHQKMGSKRELKSWESLENMYGDIETSMVWESSDKPKKGKRGERKHRNKSSGVNSKYICECPEYVEDEIEDFIEFAKKKRKEKERIRKNKPTSDTGSITDDTHYLDLDEYALQETNNKSKKSKNIVVCPCPADTEDIEDSNFDNSNLDQTEVVDMPIKENTKENKNKTCSCSDIKGEVLCRKGICAKAAKKKKVGFTCKCIKNRFLPKECNNETCGQYDEQYDVEGPITDQLNNDETPLAYNNVIEPNIDTEEIKKEIKSLKEQVMCLCRRCSQKLKSDRNSQHLKNCSQSNQVEKNEINEGCCETISTPNNPDKPQVCDNNSCKWRSIALKMPKPKKIKEKKPYVCRAGICSKNDECNKDKRDICEKLECPPKRTLLKCICAKKRKTGGICEKGICDKAHDLGKKGFTCKCKPDIPEPTECTDYTCVQSKKKNKKLEDLKSICRQLRDTKAHGDGATCQYISVKNACDQTGEPIIEVEVDAGDMCVLNQEDLKCKVKTLGKSKYACDCLSNFKKYEFSPRQVCKRGVCQKAHQNQTTYFNCKCPPKPTHCNDLTCGGSPGQNVKYNPDGSVEYDVSSTITTKEPLFHINLDKKKMCIINAEEIKHKVTEFSDQICESGLCRQALLNKDNDFICKCLCKKPRPVVRECDEKSCTKCKCKKVDGKIPTCVCKSNNFKKSRFFKDSTCTCQNQELEKYKENENQNTQCISRSKTCKEKNVTSSCKTCKEKNERSPCKTCKEKNERSPCKTCKENNETPSGGQRESKFKRKFNDCPEHKDKLENANDKLEIVTCEGLKPKRNKCMCLEHQDKLENEKDKPEIKTSEESKRKRNECMCPEHEDKLECCEKTVKTPSCGETDIKETDVRKTRKCNKRLRGKIETSSITKICKGVLSKSENWTGRRRRSGLSVSVIRKPVCNECGDTCVDAEQIPIVTEEKKPCLNVCCGCDATSKSLQKSKSNKNDCPCNKPSVFSQLISNIINRHVSRKNVHKRKVLSISYNNEQATKTGADGKKKKEKEEQELLKTNLLNKPYPIEDIDSSLHYCECRATALKQKMKEEAQRHRKTRKREKHRMKVDKKYNKAYRKRMRQKEKLRKLRTKTEEAWIEKEMKRLSSEMGKKETNFLSDLIIGTVKFAGVILKNTLIIGYKVARDPKGSWWYVKNKVQDPDTTKYEFKSWFDKRWKLRKMKCKNTWHGSETLTIMSDEVQARPVYKFFRPKGKTLKDVRRLEREDRDRDARMRKRKQQALYCCRHNLLLTMRKHPCLWVYYLWPSVYPQCLGCLENMRNFSHVCLFCLAVLVWSPCLICFEMCRALTCCIVM